MTPHLPYFVQDIPDVLTTLHPTGRIVLAKVSHNEIVTMKYGNRTQAEKKAAQLGIQWECYKGLGRPFYVAMKPWANLLGPVPDWFPAP